MAEHANVSTFVACDKVIQEEGTHKKTIIGIFKNFNFNNLPARFGPWFIFAQISNLDSGKADVTINIVHDSTQGVVFAARLGIPEDHPEDIDICIRADAAEFDKEGKYVATLNIDGQQCAYYVLTVSLTKQQTGG